MLGNKRLCDGIPELKLPRCTLKASKEVGGSFILKLIVLIGCVVICSAIIMAVLVCCYRRRNSKKERPFNSSFEDKYMKVSYRELQRATNGFSVDNLIGSGSHGSVYKGILDSNLEIVAVKVLNIGNRGASKSFAAECRILRNVKHRNLI